MKKFLPTPRNQVAYIWGTPISYQRWSICLGQNIVCLLWMETLIKNKAKQNKNNLHTTHLSKTCDKREGDSYAQWPQWQQQDTLSDRQIGR